MNRRLCLCSFTSLAVCALRPGYGAAVVQQPSATTQPIVSGGRALSRLPPDPLYDQAVAVVMRYQEASTSLVQRHLKLRYSRAVRLLQAMEDAGLVGPSPENGLREILVGRV